MYFLIFYFLTCSALVEHTQGRTNVYCAQTSISVRRGTAHHGRFSFVFLVLESLFAMCGMRSDEFLPTRGLPSLQQQRKTKTLQRSK